MIWHTFSGREKALVIGLLTLTCGSLAALGVQFYYAQTIVAPALGGSLSEAMVGIPRFINPALAQISDTDRDITRLVYSGLMKYNKGGVLLEDLAESYTIEENKIYTFKLRDNIYWHDGQPFNADDVVFTIRLIQDPKYASPLRFNWQGVEVEEVDEQTVRFKLPSPYSPFLENATAGILPKHVWENVPPNSFALAESNLQPVGTGPYRFEKFQKDSTGTIKSYILKAYGRYHGGTAFIERLVFKFFDSEDESLAALKSHEVDSVSFISGQNKPYLDEIKSITPHNFSLPRYFAVFFNQIKAPALAEKDVRKALAIALNREEIIMVAAGSNGVPAFGPIVPELLGYNPQIETKYSYDPESAKAILEKNGWTDKDADGIREKTKTGATEPLKLEFRLVTVQWPELERVIQVLKRQWEAIGASVSIEAYTLGEIQQEYMRPREYEALLFGQVIGIDPDPFSFWHSSQKKDPGLNIALYENKTVDKLLEEARQTLDSKAREERYVQFQDIITEDLPAIFLYSPTYIYPASGKIKNIREGKVADPSWRFIDINEWYIDTRRVWK